MNFDFVSSGSAIDPGAFAVMQDPPRTVVLICDGAGSWGTGIEAAAWGLQYLKQKWSGRRLPEVNVLLEDVATLRTIVPQRLLQCEFDWTFSLALLDCCEDTVRYFSVGTFAVLLFDGKSHHTLFQPPTIGTALLAEGRSPDDANVLKYRHILTGPSISDESFAPKLSGDVSLSPGHSLFVIPNWALEHLDGVPLDRALSSPTPALALATMLETIRLKAMAARQP